MKDKCDTLAPLRVLSFTLVLATILPAALALVANDEPEPAPAVQMAAPQVAMPEYDFEIPDYNRPATEYAYMTQDWVVYYPITAEDRRVLECIVEGEAGTEGLEGKMWVATCLLNAMKREGDASAAFVRKQYQYAGWSENVTDETITAVSRVFDDGELMHDTVLWFYAPKHCYSKWHEAQKFVAEVGGHRLFAPW